MMSPFDACEFCHSPSPVNESLNISLPNSGVAAGFGVAVEIGWRVGRIFVGNQIIVGVGVIPGVAVNNTSGGFCSFCWAQPANASHRIPIKSDIEQILRQNLRLFDLIMRISKIILANYKKIVKKSSHKIDK
jgi:hypothetical protein